MYVKILLCFILSQFNTESQLPMLLSSLERVLIQGFLCPSLFLLTRLPQAVFLNMHQKMRRRCLKYNQHIVLSHVKEIEINVETN